MDVRDVVRSDGTAAAEGTVRANPRLSYCHCCSLAQTANACGAFLDGQAEQQQHSVEPLDDDAPAGRR